MGETSSTTRIFPVSRLNRARKSAGPRTSTSAAGDAAEDRLTPDAHQTGEVAASARLATTKAIERRVKPRPVFLKSSVWWRQPPLKSSPTELTGLLESLMVSNALAGKRLPIYGDGMQVRDWLYVDDHCRGILAVLRRGREGEIYNIGGNRALPNIEVVKMILKATGKPESLMTTVADRPGHDRRYALTSEKLERETGWKPQVEFEQGLASTVEWYKQNQEWVRRVKSGAYQEFYRQNYSAR